ncbi:hypothetical protein EV648_10993 [Kribbella sp. VKM Ac-2568]|nr:hypothetical protein EV648_10993 [Kribbella sp. VKM Ac-2568]
MCEGGPAAPVQSLHVFTLGYLVGIHDGRNTHADEFDFPLVRSGSTRAATAAPRWNTALPKPAVPRKGGGVGARQGCAGVYRVVLSERTASMVGHVHPASGGKAVQATQYRAVAPGCGARCPQRSK